MKKKKGTPCEHLGSENAKSSARRDVRNNLDFEGNSVLTALFLKYIEIYLQNIGKAQVDFNFLTTLVQL